MESHKSMPKNINVVDDHGITRISLSNTQKGEYSGWSNAHHMSIIVEAGEQHPQDPFLS